jgi:hypothetical protein
VVNHSLPAGALGFNLVDVSSAAAASELPAGALALGWIGLCGGVDAAFLSVMQPYVGHSSNVYGFYVVDEPDPTGQWHPLCPPANLKAESDWIHANIPGAKTFIVLMNMGEAVKPTFANTYTPSNSGIDLFGLDPYPCHSTLAGCDYTIITKTVQAAESAGIPAASIVPVYQTFGGGGWVDDMGGSYLLPTVAQETQILSTWAGLIPTPPFDYAYAWSVQNSDTPLSLSPELQQVFKDHNSCTP